MDDKLLSIYLNDHLAGSTAGLELARRLYRQNKKDAGAKRLGEIAAEIEEDREVLRDVMRRVGAAENPFKTTLARVTERAGRLKLNGQLLGYSPLSKMEELEALRLGVEGKLALWRALEETRAPDSRLKGVDLPELQRRAERQREDLETMRLGAAREAFGVAGTQRAKP